jgi:hypothetical protein
MPSNNPKETAFFAVYPDRKEKLSRQTGIIGQNAAKSVLQCDNRRKFPNFAPNF